MEKVTGVPAVTESNVVHLYDQMHNLIDEAKQASPSLKSGGGDGTSDSMETVDAKIAAAEARTDTKFAELRGDIHLEFAEIKSELAKRPSTAALIGIVATSAVSVIGIILGVIAFGGDRFDAGVGMADIRQSQIERDASQDKSVQQINDKLDQLIAAQSGAQASNLPVK